VEEGRAYEYLATSVIAFSLAKNLVTQLLMIWISSFMHSKVGVPPQVKSSSARISTSSSLEAYPYPPLDLLSSSGGDDSIKYSANKGGLHQFYLT